MKPAFASLTIGSGSAAMVLVDRRLSRHGNRLLGGAVGAHTDQCHLCQGGSPASAEGSPPLLMSNRFRSPHARGRGRRQGDFCGIAPGLTWQREQIQQTFCHQVGRAHRKLMLEALGLDPSPISPPSSGWAIPARSRCR